jgi:uncharacterized damage-inducible protein DinB
MLLCAVLPAFAAADAFKAVFARHWQTSKVFSLAVAEAMPADSYDFKPNPEQMSFARLMIHIADEVSQSCARAAKTKPLAGPAEMTKAAAIRFLTDAYDKCAREIDAMTPEQLDSESYKWQGRPVVAWESLWFGFTHAAHHRAQAEVYLRMKNIKPPGYQF